jgi:short-subunit dehydrogenase
MSLPQPAPGQTILITGASSGIGTELAKQLAALGHGVTLVARRREVLDQLADEVRRAHGVEATVIAADLIDADERVRLIEEVRGSGAVVAGLCNNAGFGTVGNFAELDKERESDMVRLNVLALHELTGAFLDPMVARGAGAIMNVASIAAFQPIPSFATYAATKAFVQSFSEALHAELHGTGVSCTTLSPGPVPTEFGERAGVGEQESSLPGVAQVAPADVAAAAIAGMLNGKRSVIPGALAKASAFGGRFVPRSVLLPATRIAAGRMNRD